MADLKPFFEVVRAKFGNLSQQQVDGFNSVVALSDGLPLQHRSYILATCWHETAHTMRPIPEFGKGAGKSYGTTYYGRGYVQLTWQANYAKASKVVGVDLVAHPDLALRPDIAGQILINGMTAGWFTGRKLSDFAADDYYHMRQIINGMDRASLIAGYAEAFELALKAVPTIAAAPAEQPAQPVPVPGSTSVTLPPEAAPAGSPHSLWAWLKSIFTDPVTIPVADPAPATGLDFLETLTTKHGDCKMSELKGQIEAAVAAVKTKIDSDKAAIADLTAKLAGAADAEDTAALKQAVADLTAAAQ